MEITAEFQMLGKVMIAALLGGLVGLEREFAERPAGLRTHMLVGATSTLFIMLADVLLDFFEPRDIVNADPVRAIEAIGIAVALDVYILAVGAAVLNLLINWGLMSLVRPAKDMGTRNRDQD